MKRPSKDITLGMVVFFFVLMFAWYIFTSGSTTFDSLVRFGDLVYSQLGDFFDPAARGQIVARGMLMERSPSFWHTISRSFAYLTQALIVVGFVGLLTKRAIFIVRDKFFIFSSIAVMFLAALILVPGLANTMNMTRFYHILLFFFAPLCVLGAELIINLIFKRKKDIAVSLLLIFVLIPYFLFQTGFVFEVAGTDSWSIPLSGYRMIPLRLYSDGYTDAYSVYGAQWVSKNVNFTNSKLYSDGCSRRYVLTIYGMIYYGHVSELSNNTKVADNGAVYLSTLNVVEDVFISARVESSWNSSDLSSIFDDLELRYTNGGSKIYKHSP